MVGGLTEVEFGDALEVQVEFRHSRAVVRLYWLELNLNNLPGVLHQTNHTELSTLRLRFSHESEFCFKWPEN